MPSFGGDTAKSIGHAPLERPGITIPYKLSYEISLLCGHGYSKRSCGTRTPEDQIGRLAFFGLHRKLSRHLDCSYIIRTIDCYFHADTFNSYLGERQ